MHVLTTEDQRELDELFDIPHNPALPFTAQQAIKNAFKLAGKAVFEWVPPGRDRSIAITNLQDSMLRALWRVRFDKAEGPR